MEGLHMKFSRFKKLLLAIVLIIVVQNGVIVVPELPEGTYTGDESVSPCSDQPVDDSKTD